MDDKPGMVLALMMFMFTLPQNQKHNHSVLSKIRLDFLDSIRALAALWVVTGHLWGNQFGYRTSSGLKGLLTNWLVYNHLAVAVFIVLSGFCLMLPVAKSRTIKRKGN